MLGGEKARGQFIPESVFCRHRADECPTWQGFLLPGRTETAGSRLLAEAVLKHLHAPRVASSAPADIANQVQMNSLQTLRNDNWGGKGGGGGGKEWGGMREGHKAMTGRCKYISTLSEHHVENHNS